MDQWQAEMNGLARDGEWVRWYRSSHAPKTAAAAVPDRAPWPARGEYGSGDEELVRDLGLRRPPYHLERDERRDLLQQLLDLEITLKRFPDFAEMVRPVLRRIMEG
jgi:hypothetical protein